jgi:hypothetical protein
MGCMYSDTSSDCYRASFLILSCYRLHSRTVKQTTELMEGSKCKILFGHPQRNRPLTRSKYRRNHNIKMQTRCQVREHKRLGSGLIFRIPLQQATSWMVMSCDFPSTCCYLNTEIRRINLRSVHRERITCHIHAGLKKALSCLPILFTKFRYY